VAFDEDSAVSRSYRTACSNQTDATTQNKRWQRIIDAGKATTWGAHKTAARAVVVCLSALGTPAR